MTSSEQSSLFDKIFNRIGKNKKNVPISNSQRPEKALKYESNNTEAPDNKSLKQSSNTFSYSSTDTLYETNSVLSRPVSYIEPGSNTDSVTLRSNLTYDLSTIREEDSNRLTMELSSNGNNKLLDINMSEVLHKLNVTNYYSPTYCDHCGLMLLGLIKQGLKCQTCGLNFHKKCIPEMSKICEKQLNIIAAKQGSNFSLVKSPNQLMLNVNVKQMEIEHTFVKRQTFTSSRYASICEVCDIKISNEKSYYECKDCQISVHSKCKSKAKKNCRPTRVQDEEMDSLSVCESVDKMSIDNSGTESDEDPKIVPDATAPNDDDQKVVDNDQMGAFKTFKQQQNKTKRTHIGLQRISQRVKKTAGYFWSGHMYYYTNKITEPITHYWKLDSKSITIFDSYRLEKKINEILLEKISIAKLSGLNFNNKEENCLNEQKCLFVLVTENEVFYCGMGNADQNYSMNVLARNFYNIFKMAYLPYGNRHGKRVSMKISAPKYEEKNLNEEYEINPQDLLGSGQFGQVYGGKCKATEQSVAIKVIDKTRFKDFQAETSIFQNEITILYNVQHPGIVKLFALFDEVDQLYIVTEKLSTDMLEMILNRRPARLTERIAKFIIYQILISLNKLHDKNIAHCDLKPENILLVENCDFPQVKICDFGYAKIIGENSFRRSMVGTPAYSPPELKQKRLYNNSIDMWSMGVIVYVSLSGTFPFEEDRDIYEQILNSNFMFPKDPWEFVSRDAIDLINHFLQVKIDRRMSVNKALQHPWFSEDFQLYLDLLDLEKRVGLKWLTTKAQEEKWNQSIHL